MNTTATLIGSGEVIGCRVEGGDGGVGSVTDVLFDPRQWIARYLVVQTGSWLPGKRVLLFCTAVDRHDWNRAEIHASLTKQQIRNGPKYDRNRPVSRHHELRLAEHFGWNPYWLPGPSGLNTTVGTSSETAPEQPPAEQSSDLYSLESLRNMAAAAHDGHVGYVREFLIDDSDWTIRYMVVDCAEWIADRQVLLGTAWLGDIDYDEEVLKVDLNRREIEAAPQHRPGEPLDREYETRLHQHYGRPPYWAPD